MLHVLYPRRPFRRDEFGPDRDDGRPDRTLRAIGGGVVRDMWMPGCDKGTSTAHAKFKWLSSIRNHGWPMKKLQQPGRRPDASTGQPLGHPHHTWPLVGGAILLGLLVALVFGQTAGFEFLNFDDDQYLDALVKRGLTWRGFVHSFTHGHVGNWHPLTTLSFMLDAEWFGDWAGGYHLHNVVLHAAATATLFIALTRLTGTLDRSLVAAGLFAVHPLRAESVAWVTERKDVLSGLFLALTLWAYAEFTRRRTPLRYLAVVAAFTAGLMSKSMLVTLPIGLLILDWWPLQRATTGSDTRQALQPWRGLVIEKLPLLVLSAASALVTIVSVGEVVRPIETLPFSVRAASSVVAYASYALQLVAPLGLAPHYPYSSTGPTAWQCLASALFVAVASGLAWRLRRPWPALLTGWLWFLVTLLPVVGFIPGGIQLIADRYTYVSQIWLVVALVWGLFDLAERRGVTSDRVRVAAAVVVVGLAVAGWWQTTHWRSSETLWRYTIAATRDNAYAHANLGSVLAQKNEPVEAAEHARRALAIEPDSLIALTNLATLLSERGGMDEALRMYRRAVQVNDKFAVGWFNLGNALMRSGDLPGAERAWQRAGELDPAMAAAWSNLARMRNDQRRFDEAVEFARRSLLADEAWLPAVLNLAQALDGAGRPAEAATAYRRVLELDPGSVVATNNLGSVLERAGRLDESAAAFRRALRADPRSPVLHYNLGVVLDRLGDRNAARDCFRAAEQGFRDAGNAEMAKLAAERFAP